MREIQKLKVVEHSKRSRYSSSELVVGQIDVSEIEMEVFGYES